jgi:molybdenum cofactor cytidylyltransferase
MIYALIPAAGKSLRMGTPKLALPLGRRSVLEHVIGALQRGGAEEVVVVLGPHVAQLKALAQEAGASTYLLTEATPDMRTTIEIGLHCLEEVFHPAPDDDWLLAPADHPALDPAVVQQLLAARQARPEKTIIVPTCRGRRGHPTLIRWSHVEGIRASPPGQGLNRYLRQHLEQTLEVPVESADVLLDLDTPEDYERLRQRWPDC